MIAPFLARSTQVGRPRTHAERVVFDAIQYVLRRDIPWRLLPPSFPPWPTVYRWFARRSADGTREREM